MPSNDIAKRSVTCFPQKLILRGKLINTLCWAFRPRQPINVTDIDSTLKLVMVKHLAIMKGNLTLFGRKFSCDGGQDFFPDILQNELSLNRTVCYCNRNSLILQIKLMQYTRYAVTSKNVQFVFCRAQIDLRWRSRQGEGSCLSTVQRQDKHAGHRHIA